MSDAASSSSLYPPDATANGESSASQPISNSGEIPSHPQYMTPYLTFQTEPQKCAHCKKTPPNSTSTEESPLKPCPKCHTTLYCSRQCQKDGYKTHKKVCASLAQEYSRTADLKMESAGSRAVKEGHRGGLQKWQFDT
ncbi:HIT/MYND zinc finger-like protein [Glarea lozoyensis ATCC 20868]|uniref:HIT/MYND zinc finger-like protein n=1 Tax=Glarea lozoyensis (strain ATCC 20868 / MF5171) TaxID=1116229 RepID=S3D642_GLAL2|nr:HIT/MYND zinc finger-like protein [Glarea lozoyensis ATCC 20868]EPE33210.1 HIT/MYND zinc finger-like protein [Glarea lozoyensis ATCC 20868]